MRLNPLSLAVVAASALAMATAASAAIIPITFVGPTSTQLNPDDIKGTGKGVVTGVLSLDVTGSNLTTPPGSRAEAGSTGISNNGATLTFSSQAEFANGSQIFDTTHFFARSVAALKALGFTDPNALELIFQPNQSGHDPATDSIHITSFEVLFMNQNGNLVTTDTYRYTSAGTLAAPSDFVGVGQGTSGYVFKLPTPTGFFNSNNNYIGMIVHVASAFTNADDGSDNFFVSSGAQVPPVPVPAAVWTGLSALAGVGVFGKLRKKLHHD